VSGAPDSTPANTQVTSGAAPAADHVPGPRAPVAGEAGDQQPPETRVDRLGHRAAAVRQRWTGSVPGELWGRLQSLDFMTRGMLLAAVLLLCFVPFMIVVEALAGQSVATTVIRRFGLDAQAAAVVSNVFTSPAATSNALTGLSYVFFVLGGVAAAAAIQELYEHVFGLQGRGLRDTPRRLVWLGLLLGVGALAGWAEPWLQNLGGPVLLALVALPAFIGFWWLTMWLLLGGRIGWRQLLPSALATGICWLGMTIFFRLSMSSTMTSNYAKYGAIGVVLALMSVLIAVGVVIILGALSHSQ
jgi:membrane protein